MPKMHLKQLGFTYSACGPFTKSKKRIQKFKETGDTNIYKNELDKTCFQHDLAYGDFKDLARRTASDKVLRNKASNIAESPKYGRYQRGLASWFITFVIKPQVVELIMKLNKINNYLKNYTNQLLKKEEFNLHLNTIFGVLI